MSKINRLNKGIDTEARSVVNSKVNCLKACGPFVLLCKALDFILLRLVDLRVLLERHFPKIVVILLFLPFVVLVFLFGWLMITLVSDD